VIFSLLIVLAAVLPVIFCPSGVGRLPSAPTSRSLNHRSMPSRFPSIRERGAQSLATQREPGPCRRKAPSIPCRQQLQGSSASPSAVTSVSPLAWHRDCPARHLPRSASFLPSPHFDDNRSSPSATSIVMVDDDSLVSLRLQSSSSIRRPSRPFRLSRAPVARPRQDHPRAAVSYASARCDPLRARPAGKLVRQGLPLVLAEPQRVQQPPRRAPAAWGPVIRVRWPASRRSPAPPAWSEGGQRWNTKAKQASPHARQLVAWRACAFAPADLVAGRSLLI